MDELPKYQSAYPYFVETAPTTRFVSLNQVKEHLRLPVSDTSQDDYLNFLIDVATGFCENETCRTLITTEFRTFRNFLAPSIELRKSPFQSLTSFEYKVNDTFTAIDSSLYYIYEKENYSFILLKDGESYPTDLDDILQAVKIVFKAGYSNDENVAKYLQELQVALLNHIAALYENRGDCDPGTTASLAAFLPNTTRSIYDQFRIREFYT